MILFSQETRRLTVEPGHRSIRHRQRADSFPLDPKVTILPCQISRIAPVRIGIASDENICLVYDAGSNRKSESMHGSYQREIKLAD